jgi:hypothetical protein
MYDVLIIYLEESMNIKEVMITLLKGYEKILNYYDGLNTKTKMMR